MGFQMTATKKQIEYIEILANDLQLDRHNRNELIKDILNDPTVNFLDELTIGQASFVISKFKEWKEAK